MAANPTLLSMPIAENGTKNIIPENQATPGNGLMSQSTGFPAECSLPLGAGGVAPDRADFNGAFHLLSSIAFMAQKGFTFNYDATQDYYAGCVVMDGGNKYLCIADMAAGTVAPSADTTHDYWIFYPVGVINKKDVITTSGTYTAPVTGWYKITVKGGGGGGCGGSGNGTVSIGGASGGEGGTSFAYEHMTAGDTATVVIGAGGTGGTAGAGYGADGGTSSVVINSNTYTGGGGKAPINTGTSLDPAGGIGGNGTINGSAGAPSIRGQSSFPQAGSSGGGVGGAVSVRGTSPSAAVNGGGGAGGYGYSGDNDAGGDGGDGFVWFEYYDAI